MFKPRKKIWTEDKYLLMAAWFSGKGLLWIMERGISSQALLQILQMQMLQLTYQTGQYFSHLLFSIFNEPTQTVALFPF